MVFARGQELERVRIENMGQRAVVPLGHHEAPILGVAMHPNDDQVAAIDLAGEVCIWSLDPPRPQPLWSRKGRESPIGPWFDADGRWLATSFGDGRIHLWDLAGPKSAEPLELRWNNRQVQAAAFHPDGRWLAAAGGLSPSLWNLSRDMPISLKGCSVGYANHGLAFTPDGSWLASVCGGNVHLWNLSPDESDRSFAAFENTAVWGIDADPSARYFYLWDVNGCRTLDLADGHLRDLPGPPVALSGAVGSQGRYVASGHWDDTGDENHAIRVHDLEAGTVHQLGRASARVDDLHFTPDGFLLASSAGTLSRWNVQTAAREEVLNDVIAFDLSPDGRYVLAKNLEQAFLHDLQRGTSRQLPTENDRVTRVTFDHTGDLLLTGHASGQIRIHPLQGGTPYVLFAHRGPISSLAVHPHGEWIASTAEEENPVIRLWPVPDAEPIHDLPRREFLEELYARTNLRVVPDAQAPAGYRLQVAPFSGWD
jgi:WD40 repeat protein